MEDFEMDDELEECDEDDEDCDDLDDESTMPCPYCRREIHEDAQRCPYCEQYISVEDAPAGPKPWWIILGVILCLLLVLGWLWG